MLALGTGFDTVEPEPDRDLDRLMVTELEMQVRVLLQQAPIAAIEGIGADEIERGSDVAPILPGQHQQDPVGHALVDQLKKLAIEIGAAPFARAGVLVTGEEDVPMLRPQIGTREVFDLKPGLGRGALLAQRLAFAR